MAGIRAPSGSSARRARGVAALVLLATSAAAACSTAITGFGAVGTFTLVDVDEAGLPFTLGDGTRIVSGSLTLDNEAKCSARTVAIRAGATTQQTFSASCTWSEAGQGLGLVWSDGSLSLGTVGDDRVQFQVSPTTPDCPLVAGVDCMPTDWTYER